MTSPVKAVLIQPKRTAEHESFRELLLKNSDCQIWSLLTVESHTSANESWLPEVIFIATSYPDQLSADAIRRLQHRYPLTGFVGVLGSWCEGEVRTGRPWPGIHRWYAHQAADQLRVDLGAYHRTGKASWSLPPTSDQADRIAMSDASLDPPPGRAFVYSHHPTQRDLWRTFFESMSWDVTTVHDPPFLIETSFDVAIFDGEDECHPNWQHVGELVNAIHPTPVIAVLNFPRQQTIKSAEQLGVQHVISKPFTWDVVRAALNDVRKLA